MGFETPGFKSDDEKAISRREFLKKAALAGGALIAGASGMKLATENGFIGEKIEKVGEGVSLEKNHLPATLQEMAEGKLVLPHYCPDRYIFKIKINNDIINVDVSKEQFDHHDVNDNVPIKYELIRANGKIKSPKLLDANTE